MTVSDPVKFKTVREAFEDFSNATPANHRKLYEPAFFAGAWAALACLVTRIQAGESAGVVLESIKAECVSAAVTGKAAATSAKSVRPATIVRRLIRDDGTEVELPPEVIGNMQMLRELLGAESTDMVRLHHLGRPLHVMLVDDIGSIRRRPVNAKATALYHANCRPGTTHDIRGHVIVCPEDDIA